MHPISHLSRACLAAFVCMGTAAALAAAENDWRGAPYQEAAGQPAPGAIRGTVQDPSGAVVPGAAVTVENAASTVSRGSVSDGDGNFHFTALEPGTYSVSIAAQGFAPWASASVAVHAGEGYELAPIVLQIASTSGNVDVAPSRHDVAAEQLKAEEKQRLFGFIPNFNVTYVPNAAPLTAGQKFHLAWATSIDPTTFLFTGAIAGYEQGRNNLRGYGQGALGYAKRFGANYADAWSGAMIGTAILPSLFHQYPRYFYK